MSMMILIFKEKTIINLGVKKSIKYKSKLSGQEMTITVSEELNKLKGKVLAPKKLEEANKLLRELKTPLPK
jgi:hypothetical protein